MIKESIISIDKEIALTAYSSNAWDNPFLILGIGLIMTLISGVIFAFSMNNKINDWKSKNTSLLPIGNFKTVTSWIMAYSGLTLIFTSALIILDFSYLKSLLVSLTISAIIGFVLWGLIKDLMLQLESGTAKEIDEYF